MASAADVAVGRNVAVRRRTVVGGRRPQPRHYEPSHSGTLVVPPARSRSLDRTAAVEASVRWRAAGEPSHSGTLIAAAVPPERANARGTSWSPTRTQLGIGFRPRFPSCVLNVNASINLKLPRPITPLHHRSSPLSSSPQPQLNSALVACVLPAAEDQGAAAAPDALPRHPPHHVPEQIADQARPRRRRREVGRAKGQASLEHVVVFLVLEQQQRHDQPIGGVVEPEVEQQQEGGQHQPRGFRRMLGRAEAASAGGPVHAKEELDDDDDRSGTGSNDVELDTPPQQKPLYAAPEPGMLPMPSFMVRVA
ncbi:hypothetical protein EJB05_29442, partial [Eragrostis curvula]